MSKAISSSAVKDALIDLFWQPVVTHIHNTCSPFFQYVHPFGYLPKVHTIIGMLKSHSHLHLKSSTPCSNKYKMTHPLSTSHVNGIVTLSLTRRDKH